MSDDMMIVDASVSGGSAMALPGITKSSRGRSLIFSSEYGSHNDWHNTSNAPTAGTAGSHAHGVSRLYRRATADKPERGSEKMPCLKHGIEFTASAVSALGTSDTKKSVVKIADIKDAIALGMQRTMGDFRRDGVDETLLDDNSSAGDSPSTSEDSSSSDYKPWEDPWGDYSESDVSDDFDDSDYGYCKVSFIYTEEDGTVKIFTEQGLKSEYSYGTSYADIGSPSGFPQRSTGYWYFEGWSETFSDHSKHLYSDLTVEARFSAAKIRIDIDLNGADDSDSDSDSDSESDSVMEGAWGAVFPNFISLPTKAGEKFNGAFLMTNSERMVARTHDSTGRGITSADYREMGSGTTNDDTYIFSIPSCKIIVCWQEPIDSTTLEGIRKTIGNIPSPFADDPSATIQFKAKGGATDVAFDKGFPDAYTIPLISPETGDVNADARVITRKQVNTLGNIGTQAQFFEQCGGYYTFDEAICAAIGGYPKTAILKFYQESTNCIRTVYSLVDNNTWNFLTNGVDGKHWKYIDNYPVMSLKVDYSDFIDIKDILFVDTGLPDFYEVPYDSYLQMHSFSYCYQQSDMRGETEHAICVTGIKDTGDSDALPVYEKVDGGFGVGFSGSSYLDIYNKDTNTTRSIEIRRDGSCNVAASVWQLTYRYGAFWCYKAPRYVVTQGSFFLNKGDMIRVRGVYRSKLHDSPWGAGGNLDNSRVWEKVYSDMDIRRHHISKFANLYRVGWE